jgi:uncharacterized membrane protein (UPF0127 family)
MDDDLGFMRSFTSSLTIALYVALLCTGCESGRQPSPQPEVSIPFTEEGTLIFKRADGTEITAIRIEIADDDSTRARGLMQRSSIPADAGMLFIFPNQTVRSFWMANTPLSLDMMFATRDGQIIDIAKYTKPLSPQNVTSQSPATYVVEVQAGFTDTWGISETDVIEWSRHEPGTANKD